MTNNHQNNTTQKQQNTEPEKEIHTTTPPNPNNWRQHANCKNKTHLMFPKTYKDITYIPTARQLCRNCEVQPQCLQYALQFPTADLHGVWAGLTPRQLAAEQRRRGIKPTKPTLAQMWADKQ